MILLLLLVYSTTISADWFLYCPDHTPLIVSQECQEDYCDSDDETGHLELFCTICVVSTSHGSYVGESVFSLFLVWTTRVLYIETSIVRGFYTVLTAGRSPPASVFFC